MAKETCNGNQREKITKCYAMESYVLCVVCVSVCLFVPKIVITYQEKSEKQQQQHKVRTQLLYRRL